MEFPQQVVTELTIPNNVPFAPGYDVIGIGTGLPPAVIAAGFPAAILFYSSTYNPTLTTPQIKYQFIADQNGTIVFGYGLVANASVSQAETIVAYEGHGFAGTDAQSQFDFVNATSLVANAASVQSLSANISFLYKGTELQTLLDAIQAQVNAQSPLGLIAYGVITSAQGPFTSTGSVKTPWFYIGANLSTGRVYRLVMTSITLNYGTANATANFFVNFTTNGTVPSATIGGATNNLITKPYTIPQFFQGVDIVYDFQVPVAAQWNFLFGLDNTVSNHPASATATPPGSVTMTIEDIGPVLSNTAHLAFTPPPPALTQYNYTQLATSTHAYYGNGSLANTNQEMYQGQSPYGPNGIQSSDAFFAGTGAGTLGYMHTTGAVAANVNFIILQVVWRHWYYSSGGIMRFGYVDSGSGYHFLGDKNVGPALATVRMDVTGSLAQTSILAGTFVGFTFGYNASSPAGNYNYYGYMDGAAQQYAPGVSFAWKA